MAARETLNRWSAEEEQILRESYHVVGGLALAAKLSRPIHSVHYKASKLGLKRYHTAATEHPTARDIAWAAGIFEGEGYCRGTDGCRASVSQKDRWLVDRLRALFGGSVGYYEQSLKGFWSYRWDVYGARARGFLLTIYQFQSPRRQAQILEAIR